MRTRPEQRSAETISDLDEGLDVWIGSKKSKYDLIEMNRFNNTMLLGRSKNVLRRQFVFNSIAIIDKNG